MDEIGALFLVLALALLVGMFISRPFLALENDSEPDGPEIDKDAEEQADQLRFALLAERERLLSALQELDFDNSLGKIPAEDYPPQRAALTQSAAEALRKLDELPTPQVDKAYQAPAPPEPVVVEPPDEALELAIASHRRSRLEKAIGFCPRCGKPVKKSDQFCSRCGMPITL